MGNLINIGVIGYGYWGPNLVRNFSMVDDCVVTKVADLRNDRLALLKKQYPSVTAVNSIKDVINDKKIEAVVIATPVSSHFEIARLALKKGKHVLVEKPMTASVCESQKLIDLAKKKNKTLMVDYTFLYTGAVQRMKTLIDKKEIGNINYFDSTRINLGLFQKDVNVLWDLAPHDISVFNYLVGRIPHSVQAIGVSHLKNGIEDIAFLVLRCRSGLIAHFNCSWSSPIKIRLMLIGGDKKMIVYDDMEPTEKVKVYDSGYLLKTDEDKRKILVDYRIGDIFVPKIDIHEALLEMAKDFVSSIKTGQEPVSNSNIGLNVVKILEMSQKSIKHHGREIPFE
jgi:predicted dehydrogenase